jgi:Putative phage tail protein
MATLVLTAVGSAIGGPVGGAIGSIIGQQVDRMLFAPKGREGPRLKELEVQTSSYGSAIPAIFGTMRVAGTVIWATDLIERRAKSGSGKGRPATTQYSYSVSMAVAISSLPILRVGRIWADGNLLRGAAGDLKVDTQFRLHLGHDNQAPDALIASAETAGECPAYRGLAYAVFEDLQLADYGNRIPSLTFEVFERETAVSLNAVFEKASSGLITGFSTETLTGYAMSGSNGSTAISPLLEGFPIVLRPNSESLELIDYWANGGGSTEVEHVAMDGQKKYSRATVTLDPANSVPSAIAVRHFEPVRDFQIGVQSSERSFAGRMKQQIDLPAALDAGSAKRIAELQLLEADRAREGWVLHGGINTEPLKVGEWIADSTGKAWRIVELEHFRGSTKISARASLAADPTVLSAASPGRNVGSPDIMPGQTIAVLIDLPVFDTTDLGKPNVGLFANGTGAGWRRAAIAVLQRNQLLEQGITAAPAIIGRTMTALKPHSHNLLDVANVLDVQMVSQHIEIGGVPDNGAICWVGNEFIRFGLVVPIGNGRYHLSDLQRGCYGTEWAINDHQIGELFVVLDAATARIIDDVPLNLGTVLAAEVLGIGDVNPVVATTTLTGRSIVPLSPVHGGASKSSDGGIELNWIRRSRIDYGWNDGVDQVMVEDGEHYLVSLIIAGTAFASWTANENALMLSPAMVATFIAAAGSQLTFHICQIGKHRQSGPEIVELAFDS